ncbi:MAG: deoxynucleoside kinase [Anaerolineae bacterium]|jgi:deoxyadenosine/deoxycytidine kinase|nr:deoxynucleoside kinase [Anaerolineae bacterium]MBT3713598.1 deoxynucleoside kinase [Anaerolineae bacterium]MBT4311738.1 deoxynucleoside kinase [Anaerolineae bacterium]MBT4458550.1 deoxynucleoside kinase [Anaerolineae bacterium]MBT6062427.1 deoxynucleoside kinase [Anaerolineae bacterium]
MSKLITFVGVSGVGKTTLAKALAKTGNFATGFEQHDTRPFQHLFDQDKSYALPNQIDYFLLRAEQERILRADPRPALIDGGLDVDFHGFARLFHKRGYLGDAELELCKRLYTQLRLALPMPELIVYLTASEKVIRERLAKRDRVNIATSSDAGMLKKYLEAWLNKLSPESVIELDVSESDLSYQKVLPLLEKAIIR